MRTAANSPAGAAGPPYISQRLADWLVRRRWIIFTLVAVLYMGSFSGNWQWGVDSANHVLVAQRLAAGEGFTHPLGMEQAFQPGLAYVTAASFRLFGEGNLLPVHLFILATALATLVCVYCWARRAFDVGTAVAIVALVAACETFFRYGYQVLTEMPFALGAALLLLGWERLADRKADAWGWAMGVGGVVIMAAFRSVFVVYLGAIVLVGLIVLARRYRRAAVVVMVVGAAGLVVLSLFGEHLPAAPRSDWRLILNALSEPGEMAHRMIAVNLPELLAEAVGEGVFAVDYGPILCVVLSLAILVPLVGLFRKRLLWGAIVVGFSAQWLIFWVEDRYMLPIVPLFAVAWWTAGRWVERRLAHPYRDWAFAAMMLLWLGPNLGKSVQYAVQRHTATPAVRQIADFADHPDAPVRLAWRMRDTVEPGAVVWTDYADPPLLSVVSRRTVVDDEYLQAAPIDVAAPSYRLVCEPNARLERIAPGAGR